MKLYADEEHTKEIEFIDFGIVEAGSSKTLIIYVHNDSNAIISNLRFSFGRTSEENLEILEAPVTIQPGMTERLIIKWSPSMQFKQGLEVPIEISGDEIYLARRHVARVKVQE